MKQVDFFAAITSGNVELVKEALENGVEDVKGNIHSVGEDMHSLTLAAKANRLEVANLLIGQSGVDVNFEHSVMGTPLVNAVANDNVEMAALLLDNGANPTLGSAFFAHATQGELFGCPIVDAGARSKEMLDLFLNRDVAVDTLGPYDTTALLLAARTGKVDNVKTLLAAGANIDHNSVKGWTPLMSALRNKHADVVDTLLQHGADVNKGIVLEAHKMEAKSVDTDEDQDIMERYADSHDSSNILEGQPIITPLILGVTSDDLALVKKLISAGADVNLRTYDGRTAIGYADMFEDSAIDIILALLKAGANPDLCVGDSPLFIQAVTHGDEDIVDLLIEYKADVNIKNNRGDTALLVAITGADPILIKKLLRAGADPYIQDEDGRDTFALLKKRTYDVDKIKGFLDQFAQKPQNA